MVTTAPDNPYATPASATPAELPDAPSSKGWQIRNGKLWVTETATLPMVDPYSGESPETMEMNRISIRYRPVWMWIFPVAGGVIAWIASRGSATFAGVVIGLLLRGLVSLMMPPVCCQVFFTARTLRSRRLVYWLTIGLFLFNLIGGFFFGMADIVTPLVFAFSGWALLGILMWSLLIRRRMKCRRMKDGWFEIRGVNPLALERFGSSRSPLSVTENPTHS
ncbi:MAG: hypothetical protein QM755_00310 [Luteolibacter sp.]